jgi:hypothetical protein
VSASEAEGHWFESSRARHSPNSLQGEWVRLEHLTTDDTSGFTIPRYVDNQRIYVSTFDLLKQAKGAGITQAQVNAGLAAQARQNGWTKA